MISKLCMLYLKLLETTCRIKFQGLESLAGGTMGGFWHEDSLAMNLFLKKVVDLGYHPSILVTADPRGDAIEQVLNACSGRAIRISYEPGAALAAARKLARFFKNGREILGVAMDGPLGPRHQPKRLPFLLGARAGCGFIGIKVDYSGVLRLKKRWDKYAVPLPFSTISFNIHDFGPLNAERVDNFEPFCELIRKRLTANIKRLRLKPNPNPPDASPEGVLNELR